MSYDLTCFPMATLSNWEKIFRESAILARSRGHVRLGRDAEQAESEVKRARCRKIELAASTVPYA